MSDKRVERPAVDVEAIRMLETDPDKYFELRRKRLPFGFTRSASAATARTASKNSN